MSLCCTKSNLISEKSPLSYPLWLLYFNLFSFLKLCPGSNVNNYFATITSVIIFLHQCSKTDQCPNPHIPRLIILQSSDWKHLLFEITRETEAQRVISWDWLKAIPWKSTRPELEPRPPDLVSPTFPLHLTPPPVSLTWSCHITAVWPWSILWTNPAQQNCVAMRFTWPWLGRNHESLRKETYKF